MSVKKSFSIPKELATGIRTTMQSASNNQGQLHYDMMALEMLHPDPNNPRKFSITASEILSASLTNEGDLTKKNKELEALKELAQSIKKIGIKHAIEVYKEGNTYRIITGERRYWAAFLLGLKTVPVRISERPDEFNLRYTQWVENINRQGLSLWEKYSNLLAIADAYQVANGGEFTEQNLQTLLGVSKIQAYRYFCLIKADEKILPLLESGKLSNLKIIQELVTFKDKRALNQILSWIASSKEEVTSISHYRLAAGKKNTSSIKKSTIKLGSIAHPATAKNLFNIVLSDQRFHKHHAQFQNIDWSLDKSVSKAFKALLKVIERECSLEEVI